MDNLIIIGAGGFGREVASWAAQHPLCGVSWKIAGFLDDLYPSLSLPSGCPPLLGSIKDHLPSPTNRYICALGRPATKQSCVQLLLERDACFINLIHPSVTIGDRVKLGQGIILCPGVRITCDSEIGDFTAINLNATVGHDTSIGAWCQISSHCDIMGHVTIGEGSLLGSSAIILPRVKVGHSVTVGAGSVVVKSVADGQTVFGNPAHSLLD